MTISWSSRSCAASASRRRELPTMAEEAEELIAFGEAASHHPAVPQHLRAERDHLARAEVEAAVHLVHRAVDLRARQVRIADGAHLAAALVDQPPRLAPCFAARPFARAR